MSNVISIISRQPIIQHPIREITNSRIDTVCARVKRDILLSLGWSEWNGGRGTMLFSHPHVADNSAMYLDQAWNSQLSVELGQYGRKA